MAVISLQKQPGKAEGPFAATRLPSCCSAKPGETWQNTGNFPLDRCFFAQIESKPATVGGDGTMKFKMDIDCTPDEARAFFGLPDVKPLQEALLPEVEERLRATLKAMDPEAMLKTWLPATLKGFEQLQQMFFANLPGASDKKK
jgi:hypothetical protein